MTHHRILVVAGSTRRASVHGLLARSVAAELDERGRDHLLIDLAAYEMPLYHGDLEAEHGVPEPAHRLADLLRTSGGLLVATPEYNGSFSPLLKNTIDWVTRIDIGVLRDTLIGLMAATPGRLGGVRGLDMVRTWFANMRLTVAESHLSIPRVHEHVDGQLDGPDGDARRFDATTRTAIAAWVDTYLRDFDEFCSGRPPA